MTLNKENKKAGLYGRYIIGKSNGKPVDPNADYFVLRLDFGSGSTDYVKASRIAVLAYTNAIEEVNPKLAADIRDRYFENETILIAE